MSFTIRFNSQKEHNEYVKLYAKKLGIYEEEKVINASDIIGARHVNSRYENDFNGIAVNYKQKRAVQENIQVNDDHFPTRYELKEENKNVPIHN